MAERCRIIELEEHHDGRGTLVAIEGDVIPFDIKRVFYIFGADGMRRGGHAHAECHQVIIALHGNATVVTDDGTNFHLQYPHYGLYVPPMNKIILTDMEYDCILLVLCSHEYDPDDYIIDIKDAVSKMHAISEDINAST
jgi:hypothetical protein